MDITRELTGFVRENYLMSFQLGLSIWERNLKIINSRNDQRNLKRLTLRHVDILQANRMWFQDYWSSTLGDITN